MVTLLRSLTEIPVYRGYMAKMFDLFRIVRSLKQFYLVYWIKQKAMDFNLNNSTI